MRRLFLFLLALTLAAVFLAIPQKSAFASGGPQYKGIKPHQLSATSATCWGAGCTHLDPYDTGCAVTKKTLATEPIIGYPGRIGRVELEYSTECGTNWTEVYNEYWTPASNIYLDSSIERFSGPDGGDLTYYYSSNLYQWTNTDQIYSYDNYAQACGRIVTNVNGGTDTKYTCTAKI